MTETFDRSTWKPSVAVQWREIARDLPGTMRRLGVSTAYGLLTASAWLPLLAAYASDPGPAVAALAAITSGVGTNLLSNLVQGTYDRATAPGRAERELAERIELRAEYQQILDTLEVLTAAQAALGEGWPAFERRLREELALMGGELHIESGGGAVVLGNVTVQHGDFVGRDKHEHHYHPPSPDTGPLRQAYLQALVAECRRLPLGVVDPRFLQTGPEASLLLSDVYVDLEVLTPPREEGDKGELLSIGRLARGEGGQRVPLLEAVAQPQATHFVLLGDPGSGKTTFVNYLTYALAQESLLPDDSSLQGMFPVRLVLREVAAHCIPPEAARGKASMLWDALRADLAGRLGEGGGGRLFPHLQRHLLEEGGLFLLDGLDEVPEADRRRACLLEAVAELAAALPPDRSRVVVTARPYAYADPGWHLAGFQVLALAPFDSGQIERFIGRWYQAVRPVMGWDEATGQERGERLQEAMEGRAYLADLASRPLLLTLMTTLHTSWGQLPEDRADLYEETVRLLLSRWQRAREVKDAAGETVTEPGIARILAVEESRVREALHRLACRVHERQKEGRDGEAVPADISEGEVLAAFAGALPENFNPRVLLGYLETRAGLLLGRAPGVYAFPHRSFQEYLAACHLADGPDFAAELRRRVWDDPAWWREVFLLGVGKARQGGLSNAVHVVNTLVPEDPQEVAEKEDIHWRAASLAGQALADLRFPGVARDRPDFEAVLRRVRRWLVALLGAPELLSPQERAEAGNVLGELGDPRPGVGILPVEVTGQSPLPDIVWCEVPAGPFLMGSPKGDEMAYDDERPQHPLDLPAFLISRYPITNAQYRPFVESGGYEQRRYWSAAGRAWQAGRREPDLSVIEDEDIRRRYADWLAGRPVEKRGQPFWWGHPRWGAPNRPVVGVTWYEALAYCNWLAEQLQVTSYESGVMGNL